MSISSNKMIQQWFILIIFVWNFSSNMVSLSSYQQILYVFFYFYFFLNKKAIITIDFDEDIRECGNGMPIPDVDLSQFSILPQDDGTMVVNGTVKIINGFGNPTRVGGTSWNISSKIIPASLQWNMYSKRQEQGKWNPGIISRDIPNFCAVLQLQTESWYQFTKHLKQGHCPIKAGVIFFSVGTFKNKIKLFHCSTRKVSTT